MKFITKLTLVVTLLLYASVLFSPAKLPQIGLLPFLIAPALAFNALLFLLLLFRKDRLFILPAVVLLIGYKFILITFQWHASDKDFDGLKVLSYNVKRFNFEVKQDEFKNLSINSIKWVADHEADIKCIQEFYTDSRKPKLDAIKQINQNGTYYHYYEVYAGSLREQSYGQAIFSRFPIIDQGKVFESETTNGAIYADVQTDQGIVRVYNFHLESMSINPDNFSDIDRIKGSLKDTYKRLIIGLQARASQIDLLLDHADQSPYPVIMMGDLNDVPYSYTYFRLKSKLENAFENAGRGFGFSFNNILVFLRIDNQFYTPDLEVKNFRTHKEVDYSDHFPIYGEYRIKSAEPAN